ncbi:MAG: TonB-dependent receptor [Vicinamibacterales bacterium]
MKSSRSERRSALRIQIFTFRAWAVATVLPLLVAAPAQMSGAQLPQAPVLQAVTGTVLTAAGTPVAGAVVRAEPDGIETATDERGHYVLRLRPGDHVLRVRHPWYEPRDRAVKVDGSIAPVDFSLDALPYRFEENVVVSAVRAEAGAPITVSNIPRIEISKRNYGQEVPFLLKEAPSLTQYADAGGGAGYSYMSLRGIQQTRLNMTLDGVPLNEPEDSAVYFSNYADLAASIDSVQIQRGVGASTFGAASYGGSVNFASVDPKPESEISADATFGSFATRRIGLTVHTGTFGPGLALFARAAYRDSDGYRRNSGARQRGVAVGVARHGERSLVRAFGFLGHARTHLAYYAVEPELLEQDRRQNPMSPDERDSFTQALAHVQYTRFLNGTTSVAGQAYFQDAGGWYRIYADAERTRLHQYGLDWSYGGAMVNLRHERGSASFNAGAHAYLYGSRHTRDVVGQGREYVNHGDKTTADAFLKVEWDTGPALLYGDLQVRRVGFGYQGSLEIGSTSWTFVNPKAGVRVPLGSSLQAYVSVGRTTREPTRADLFAGEDNPTILYALDAVESERVTDVEGGLTLQAGKVTATANLYFMEFRNEIALTGELSEIGLPLRRNVPRSHRRGVEFDIDYRPTTSLRFAANATISHDRIARWTQFYDVFDGSGGWVASEPRTFDDVRPLLTPAATLNQRVEVEPVRGFTFAASGRWVAEAWLDNTNTLGLRTPSWLCLDLTATIPLARWVPAGEPRLRVQVDNVLDNRGIYPSGYSYQYLVRGPGAGTGAAFGVRYFYPQATRSVFVGLDVRM